MEGIEEEDEKNEKSEEKKINNEDYELSVDFNSEIEAEQERQSKTMTREEMAKAIMELNDEDFKALKIGINHITFEYGWAGDLDNSELIRGCWKEEI